MRRVDAHHHLWDPARRAYPWMDERLAPFQRRFGPEDLDAAAGPHGIGQTVVVQTVASVEETKEFLAVAGTGGRVAGVVGWVDLTVADVADAVAALRAAPGGEVLVGIRHQVHDEPDPAWLLHGEVLAGLAAVAEAGLAYDLLVRERELPAGRWPSGFRSSASSSTTWPSRGSVRGWSSRATELRALARLPNVTCKVSGLVTEADWDAWTPEQLVRYVATAADAFGPDRLLFGSDWPVCLLAADYAEVVMAAEQALEAAGLDAAERDLVFGANARRGTACPSPPTTTEVDDAAHPAHPPADPRGAGRGRPRLAGAHLRRQLSPRHRHPARRPAGVPEPLPGRVTVTEVLTAMAATVPLEAAAVMQPDDADEPAVLGEYRRLLPPGSLSRWWSGWRSTS